MATIRQVMRFYLTVLASMSMSLHDYFCASFVNWALETVLRIWEPMLVIML